MTEMISLDPNEISLIPPSHASSSSLYPTAIEVQFEKRTDLRKQKQHEIIFVKLSYVPKPNDNYEWEIIKCITDFKNFLSHINYILSSRNKSDPLISQISSISSLSFNHLKSTPSSTIISVFNKILSLTLSQEDDVYIKEFFEISSHSFVSYNNGIKPKEGYILKRAEYNICQTTCIDLCKCIKCCCCASYIKFWFLLKEDMMCYLDASTSQIGKNTFWFDKSIKLEKEGRYLTLRNTGRKMKLKFDKTFERDIWYNEINWRIEKYISNIKPNIYHSFVYEKTECRAKWFIDGEDYFKDVREKLLAAKETVFITDWWMSPELFLKRPVNMKQYQALTMGQPVVANNKQQEDNLTRLCDVLNHIAHKGVRVYILVFCEFELALTLNSKHTKTFLVNLHENIKVTRHPKKSIDLLWSHHEKLVVIDQRYAYVGGLDLCWGRFDTHKHPLSDIDNTGRNYYMFPGIDYSNARVADFANVEDYLKEAQMRGKPRMPWHDIHSMLEGPAVLDVARHFVERWNYIKAYANSEGITDIQTKYVKQETIKSKLVFPELKPKSDQKSEHVDQSVVDEELNFDAIAAKPQSPSKSSKNVFSKLKHLSSKYENANNVSVNQGRQTSIKQKILNKFSVINAKRIRESIGHWVNLNSYKVNFRENEAKMTCQCLRSLSNWSSGLQMTECSVLEGYYNLIDNAKHYIYIENQFFVSKSFTDDEHENNKSNVSNLIINEIALHIRNRIIKAHENNEKFRAIIFIPLLPGFAGDVETSSTLQIICKYTYKTISRNKGLSLIEKLQELLDSTNPDLFKRYISFFSLRTHELINSIPYTELIYIHSKLMIVDDMYVIMGSANINDRSMIGERDSEFAVIYKEEPMEVAMMNGEEMKVSRFAKSLRVNLFKEHLGIDDTQKELCELVNDPLSDELWEFMNERALKNTLTYREVFNCYPDDTMISFKDVPKQSEMNENEIAIMKEKYMRLKDDIKGHIVQFPLWFLKEEILERSFFSAEMLVPIKNFV